MSGTGGFQVCVVTQVCFTASSVQGEDTSACFYSLESAVQREERRTRIKPSETWVKPTSAVWKILKKNECSGTPRKTEESSKARPTDQNQPSGGRWVSVRDDCPQKTS